MLNVVNPATEEVIARLQEDDPASIKEKFSRGAEAQQEWARLPLSDRLKVVRAFRALAVERKEKLAQILTSEVGKPITQSRNELEGLLGRIDFFVDHVERVLQSTVVLEDPAQRLEEKISHEPLGVIAHVSAWNYPYYVGSNVILPALLAGNAVLYKPSEFASLTGRAIVDLFEEAKLPKGVLTVVIGDGKAGAELVRQPLAGVFFTGSYATGRKIAEATASRLIKVQLELGGKDPVYVCDDVDVRIAAEGIADGAFYNAGQSCCAVERIYVHRRIHEAFVEAFVKTVNGFVIGDPTDPATYLGPLARGSHLAVLERQVADAAAKGAKILCGGNRLARPGFFFEPTVLVQVDHSMEVMKEETFGPVIGIQAVASDEGAVSLMNDTDYGLTAGVYSRDRSRAERLLSRIDTGTVYWNCCDRVSPRLPWSGRGHSGIGTTLSTHGIQTFTQPKAWHLKGL